MEIAFFVVLFLTAHVFIRGWIKSIDVKSMATTSATTLKEWKTDAEKEKDWSGYDTPTFLRRGGVPPVLEPVQAKAKTRKRRSKAKADAATFEVVA